MAIKKYSQLKGWSDLDAYYGKRIEGVHIVIENFDRVFCRCGMTHASEGGVVHKCPKCGNTDFLEQNTNNYYYSSKLYKESRYEMDDSLIPLSYRINETSLGAVQENNRTVLRYTKETTPIYELKDDDIVNISPSAATSSRGHGEYNAGIDVEILKKWPKFETFEDFEYSGNIISLQNLKEYLDIKRIFKDVINDDLYIQYPSLGHRMLTHTYQELKEFKSATGTGSKKPIKFETLLNYYNMDRSFLGIYDYFERQQKNSYFSIFENRGGWKDKKYMYYELQNYKKNKSKGYTICEPYILNGMVSLKSASNLIAAINDFYSSEPNFNRTPYDFRTEAHTTITNEIKEMLPVYIKNNISLKTPETIVYDFVRDVETLQELKIAITEENLKVKNLNYYLNQNRLATTYKLPPDKTECFIDLFEKNPLKAITLIENRRKMTKKQLQEFIENISKES